jgi:Serine dehydrogenase proteinase
MSHRDCNKHQGITRVLQRRSAAPCDKLATWTRPERRAIARSCRRCASHAAPEPNAACGSSPHPKRDAIGDTDRLSLILYTQGGNTAAAWRLANLLRMYCKDLEIIVPMKAHSAGTLISLGANRIIMTKQATLGPIHPSINTMLNPQIPGAAPQAKAPVSVEAVMGYLEAARDNLKITDASALAQILDSTV